jgi:hypothetical protein
MKVSEQPYFQALKEVLQQDTCSKGNHILYCSEAIYGSCKVADLPKDRSGGKKIHYTVRT